MNGRDLDKVAERVRRDAGLSGDDGRLLVAPVDVERIAENLGLRIVGSEPRGMLRLPAGRKGQIRIDRRLLIVRPYLLDDEARDVDLREVVAHEIAHDVLHADFLAQRPLPFGAVDARHLAVGRLSFSRKATDQIEREAIYLGALIQVPATEMREVVRPAVEAFAAATIGAPEALSTNDLASYRKDAEERVATAFSIAPRTAKIALDYWQAASRPPREWIGSLSANRRTHLL